MGPQPLEDALEYERPRPLTAQPDIPQAKRKPVTARVVSVEEIARDTRIYRLDAAGLPPHRAGQYAFIHAEGFSPREYSIASAPEAGYLEFHIKSTGRGGMSDHIFETWQAGASVLVDAPYGDHYWRPSKRPLLALAGGVGIAPLSAILSAHFVHAKHSPAHLYWGVRDITHLYLDNAFRLQAKEHPAFHYVPLLAEKPEGSTLRTGFIAPALEQDFASLEGFAVYIAGPRGMVEATLPALLALGAEREWLFSDAFG